MAAPLRHASRSSTNTWHFPEDGILEGMRTGATGIHQCAHGTPQKYKKGCRCDDCRAAMRKRIKEDRAAGKLNHLKPSPKGAVLHIHPHGTSIRWREGCRCDTCKAWKREDGILRRERNELGIKITKDLDEIIDLIGMVLTGQLVSTLEPLNSVRLG